MPHTRIALLMAAVPLLALIFAGRLVMLQVVEHEEHVQRAERIRMTSTLVPPRRASIVDRHGVVLAEDVPSWKLELNYWLFTEPENVLKRVDYRDGVPGMTAAERHELEEYVTALAKDKARGGSRQARFLRTWPGRTSATLLPAPYHEFKLPLERKLARRLERSVEELRAGRELLRREIAASLEQLARIVEVEPRELHERFELVERAVDAKLYEMFEGEARRTKAYQEIVRMGSNAGYWNDRARAERRSGRPRERWQWQSNPLVLATELERTRIETVVELDRIFFGVRTRAGTRRVYPHGELACHVLGYLRPVDRVGFSGDDEDGVTLDDSPYYRRLAEHAERDVGEEFIARHFRNAEAFQQRFRYDLMRHSVGVVGLERAYEARLTGRFGASVVERDVRARSQRLLDEVTPQAAEPLELTLDARLQRRAQDSLGHAFQRWATPGAAVLLDVHTGEVLALASSPTYDLNRFGGSSLEDRDYVRRLLDGEVEHGKPLINRAVNATSLPPGSVMKVLSGIAVVEEGLVAGPDFRSGELIDGRWSRVRELPWLRNRFSCHVFLGRVIGLVEALERSSNEYFYEEGHRLGYERLAAWARRFGFGEPTGIDLDSDPRGWRPTQDPDRFEAALTAIGQGTMQSSPLQLARFTAGVATRGTLPAPRLVREAVDPTAARHVEVAPATWNAVHEGMRRVVHGAAGTARGARGFLEPDVSLRDVNAAAKTGTAQTGRTRDGESLNHAWIAAYAPYDEPQVAVVVFIEDTFGYGGTRAAPVAIDLLHATFNAE